MRGDDIRWLDESDDWRTISPEANPALKHGFFMGGATVVDGNYVHKYGKYRDQHVIKELAPSLLLTLLGPLNTLVVGEALQDVIRNIDTEVDWSNPDKLDVYSFEFPGGVFWVANHIPDAPEMSFEMIADHSECTETHCTQEDNPA